jgi:hypothetical protein
MPSARHSPRGAPSYFPQFEAGKLAVRYHELNPGNWDGLGTQTADIQVANDILRRYQCGVRLPGADVAIAGIRV